VRFVVQEQSKTHEKAADKAADKDPAKEKRTASATAEAPPAKVAKVEVGTDKEKPDSAEKGAEHKASSKADEAQPAEHSKKD
jgi:hypothetical protein